jgi:hypothetical protein
LALATVVYCLSDGHAGIWSLYEQMPLEQEHLEILDWFHLKQNLIRVGGSLKRLYQAEALLWQGKVDQTIDLFQALRSESVRKFCAYLQTHRSRIPNYDYYQSDGIPIGSGPAESWIKQIDQRLQLTGAQWLPRNVPQMLALRCRYLSDQLDLYSLSRR